MDGWDDTRRPHRSRFAHLRAPTNLVDLPLRIRDGCLPDTVSRACIREERASRTPSEGWMLKARDPSRLLLDFLGQAKTVRTFSSGFSVDVPCSSHLIFLRFQMLPILGVTTQWRD